MEITFSLPEIVPLLGLFERFPVFLNGSHYQVKLNTLRLRTFKKSLVCSACGKKGVIFRIKEDKRNINPHLNLYCSDGTLMTHDHTIPLSKGGKNNWRNVTTMCDICNNKKADIWEGE